MKRLLSIVLALLMLAAFIPSNALIASADAENVALGKTVTGEGSGHTFVTDGQINTGNYWDGGMIPASAVIDLGDYYKIEKVLVVTYYGDGRAYRFTVLASPDGLHYETVGEKDDNKTASSAGTSFECDVTARYIRVDITANTVNNYAHLVEVKAFGTPAPDYVPPEVSTTDPDDPDNIAYCKPTRTNNSPAGLTYAVNDGDKGTVWRGIDLPRYVDIDLMKNYDLTSVKVIMPNTGTFSYALYGSLDGIRFDLLAKVGLSDSSAEKEFTFENKTVRILRLNVTGNNVASSRKAAIAEIKAFGTESQTPVTETREKIVFDSYETWLKENCGVDVAALKDENGKYDIKDTYTEADTVAELNGMVTRLLGEQYVSWFDFATAKNPNGGDKDFFRIEDANGKVRITGSDGTCIASGLNWYLKYFCYVHIAQQTKQVKMPEKIVPVGTPIFYETPFKVRYAYNYCTLSYTMAFFGYDDWRRELDWLYLNGINLILDTTATEALWVYYLQQLGYNADDAKNYVCGYAYKAWWLMGNLEGYGGTVSDSWVLDTLEMARVNQRSMAVMGAQPALQMYVGAMPESFGTLAKQTLKDLGYGDVSASLAAQGNWAGSLVRPNVLRTDYDGYSYLAQLFYQSQEYVYGQNTDYYCGDVCHEGGIIPAGLVRQEMSAKILSEMMDYDKDGVWIIQRWWDNPIREVLDGFGKYRKSNVMVIDLGATQNTGNYKDTSKYGSKEFGGTLWIFSTLNDYGGNPGMHGNVDTMITNIAKAKEEAKYLVGLGMTPEGTFDNPYMFDLYWEMVWRDEKPALGSWTKDYCRRRYGSSSENLSSAWKTLRDTIYKDGNADDGGPVRFTVLSVPKFDYSGGYYVTRVRYAKVWTAIESLMKDFDKMKDNECYIYDLVDAMTTYLNYFSTSLLTDMGICANKPTEAGIKERFMRDADKYLECILLINEICAYNKDEMVGNWIGRAYDFTTDERTGEYDDYTLDMMTFNAKALITAWHSSTLIDYACRRYNGVVSDYYYQAWNAFLTNVKRDFSVGRSSVVKAFDSSTYFLYAWKFICNEVEYEGRAKEAAGGRNARGLKAIFDHIDANFTQTTSKNDLLSITPAEKSGLTVTEGAIFGVGDNDLLSAVAEKLAIPEGTALKFRDAAGNELQGSGKAEAGCMIELYKDDARVDALVIGTTDPSEEDLKIGAAAAEAEEFLTYAGEIDRATLTEEAAAALDDAVNSAKKLILKGKRASEEDLARTASKIAAAKDAVKPADEPTDPTPGPNGEKPAVQKYVWIFVAVGAALLVGAGAAVIALAVKGKKKKTQA